jgi:hypothetical protein
MDLMNAAKYMSAVWVAKAPGMMHSQPSQPISFSQNISAPDTASASPRAQSISPSDPVKPVSASKNLNAVEQSSQAPKLSEEKQQQQAFEQVVAQLKARDREVRTHEQAHLSAAGAYATGGINYNFQTGPDGQKYAVGGSVGIDTSPVSGDPEATIQKMQVVQRAAMAPAQPSSQDFKVASQAAQLAAQARGELQAERSDEMIGNAGTERGDTPSQVTSVEKENQVNNIQSKDQQGALGNLLSERNAFDLRLRLQDKVA